MVGRINGKTPFEIWTVKESREHSLIDQLATEEPLEIRLVPEDVALSVTMRTPGADFDLVTGFLLGEGVIDRLGDIVRLEHSRDASRGLRQRNNTVEVTLRDGVCPDLEPLERRFMATSACGVCGKASIEALRMDGYRRVTAAAAVAPEILYALPGKMRAAQKIFSATGGLHAAGLFDLEGRLLIAREDIGRHNALDKVIGAALRAGEAPLSQHIVMVSGRASYEIVQKCVAAGAPIVCAVSAPSSLAATLAHDFGVTLIGFLRDQRFNLYTHKERIAPAG